MNEFILNFAPTGMVPTKSMNFNTPISVSEIVDDVLMATQAGAAIAHLHARDEQTGCPILDPDVYGLIIEGIRRHEKEVILCVSLSGRDVSDPALRCLPLALDGESKPDMGSLTLSSLNFSATASVNSPTTIVQLAETLKDRGIYPELEIFDLGMANFLHLLIKRGLLPSQLYANVLLGNVAGAQATFAHIAALLSSIPGAANISFGGLGDFQLRATSLALSSGFGVRVGLEDNLWFDRKRTKLATNSMLVRRVVCIADHMELTPKKPAAVRRTLGLAPGNGRYGYSDRRDALTEERSEKLLAKPRGLSTNL